MDYRHQIFRVSKPFGLSMCDLVIEFPYFHTFLKLTFDLVGDNRQLNMDEVSLCGAINAI